jgi:predicted nucleotidyltransferase component of viral defense system
MGEPFLDKFVLVGGTALALQIGHRKSVDLDFFTPDTFEPEYLLSELLISYSVKPIQRTSQSLICTIDDIKVDFIYFRYPFIRPVRNDEGIRLLSPEDIAPMKLDAISGRGSKKDFYDIYFLLREMTLEKMFSLYLEKYPHQTTFHVLRSLAYFNDAEKDPEPFLFDTEVSWSVVKNKIKEVIRNYG